jgi:hypothetical protein
MPRPGANVLATSWIHHWIREKKQKEKSLRKVLICDMRHIFYTFLVKAMQSICFLKPFLKKENAEGVSPRICIQKKGTQKDDCKAYSVASTGYALRKNQRRRHNR